MNRAIDLLLVFLLLFPLTPLMLLISLWIRSESPGEVIYRGLRIGKRGKPFRICKFRTMVLNADKIGGPSTALGDPRITRIGKFLRRNKLDEFPQLLNVLSGEMSFVGPRPEVPQYVSLFTPEERIILSVRPGITDWASIWNSDEAATLAEAEDAEQAYLEVIRPEKIRLQMKYVRERTILVDFAILARTAWWVLRRALRWRRILETA